MMHRVDLARLRHDPLVFDDALHDLAPGETMSKGDPTRSYMY